jgi:hypothetical protein
MQRYQTTGTDSIPKLICLRADDLSEVFTWGPRPAVLQNMIAEFKASENFDYKESVRMLHQWYEQDMAKSIQEELTDLIKRVTQ